MQLWWWKWSIPHLLTRKKAIYKEMTLCCVGQDEKMGWHIKILYYRNLWHITYHFVSEERRGAAASQFNQTLRWDHWGQGGASHSHHGLLCHIGTNLALLTRPGVHGYQHCGFIDTTNAGECFLFRSCTNWYLESFPQPDNLVLFVNIYNNGLNWPRINWLQTGFCLNILKCIYKFKCHWSVAIN